MTDILSSLNTQRVQQSNTEIFQTKKAKLAVQNRSDEIAETKGKNFKHVADSVSVSAEARALQAVEAKTILKDGSAALSSSNDRIDAFAKVDMDFDDNGVVDTNDLLAQLSAIGGDDLSYDHNQDGTVDVTDLDLLRANFGRDGQFYMANPDIDGSGSVDVNDLMSVLSSVGDTAVDGQNPSGDLNQDGVVDQADIDMVLAMFGQNMPEDVAQIFKLIHRIKSAFFADFFDGVIIRLV